MKEGSQDSLTQKNSVRTCLQVHIHGQWMLPSLMRSFVGQSSIRELCPPAFNELTVDLLLPVCYNRIHIYICICIPGALIAWRFKQKSHMDIRTTEKSGAFTGEKAALSRQWILTDLRCPRILRVLFKSAVFKPAELSRWYTSPEFSGLTSLKEVKLLE